VLLREREDPRVLGHPLEEAGTPREVDDPRRPLVDPACGAAQDGEALIALAGGEQGLGEDEADQGFAFLDPADAVEDGV